MSVTDELPADNARYAETFEGPLPLPPAEHLAVVACMDARLNAGSVITQDEIRPSWAAEAYTDLDADVRQSIARIKAESSRKPAENHRAELIENDRRGDEASLSPPNGIEKRRNSAFPYRDVKCAKITLHGGPGPLTCPTLRGSFLAGPRRTRRGKCSITSPGTKQIDLERRLILFDNSSTRSFDVPQARPTPSHPGQVGCAMPSHVRVDGVPPGGTGGEGARAGSAPGPT